MLDLAAEYHSRHMSSDIAAMRKANAIYAAELQAVSQCREACSDLPPHISPAATQWCLSVMLLKSWING
jgi:hypothetical protein